MVQEKDQAKMQAQATNTGSNDKEGKEKENKSAKEQPKDLPLDGIRVVDVGTFIAGPYAATIMGEFGADVYHVEHPLAGDPFRRLGTPTDRDGDTLAWLSEARNKKSVTIDLRVPKGAELFKRLIAKSDVCVESFRPGMLESWGLGWKELSKVNPGLVMLRVTGYGQTGPYRNHAGFSHLAHAFGGLSYLSGFPGQTPVIPSSSPLGDYMSGLYGAIGVLMALRYKELTGEGQYIDLASYEAVFRQLDEMASAYGMFGKVREREGSGTVIAVPHGHFQTKDGKWVAIACTNNKMFARLAENAMGRPELTAENLYGLKANRLERRDEVNALVSEWTGSLTRDELMGKCLAAEVPIGSLNSVADIFADPHFQARDDLVHLEEDIVGDVVIPGVFPKLSETPGRVTSLGPALGKHTDEVLGEVLGLSAAELKQLHQNRVV
uniref:Succinyl-CoA:(S)-malate CoA-transferase subunit A n=1 Tax=Candidatus Kentrum sp. FM TaxID=2126340 RepID=A0A450SII7_9GAMM|nr:MAG: succinyl-CoA:(S)-malate CoA-transferase subunit A [Candidatus Kentron sp. FM]VFJ67169.1 MAG: succinyl-CoA:(S)-malate CoA-transferase subunit A [Candidatus Kentron sp. FM]VFK05908.1 MAG: succinyl-CoA:(S)-malate CoA-transferase subunit A [Candidatus Kentron sp. FM]